MGHSGGLRLTPSAVLLSEPLQQPIGVEKGRFRRQWRRQQTPAGVFGFRTRDDSELLPEPGAALRQPSEELPTTVHGTP